MRFFFILVISGRPGPIILSTILRDQSFTSLKADFRQDINVGFHFAGALMEHFLEGSAPLRLW